VRDRPTAGSKLLRLALSSSWGASVAGDLEEEWRRRFGREPRGWRAELWLAGQAFAIARETWWARLRDRLRPRRASRLPSPSWGAGRHPWRGLGRDIRHGARSLVRQPLFTTTAIVTLALGIGAPVALYSVLSGVLLRPLPYRDPDRLVLVGLPAQDGTGRPGPATTDDFEAWRGLGAIFEEVAGYQARAFKIDRPGGGPPEEAQGATITPNLLPLLGVQPSLGRAFLVRDDGEAAEDNVLLVSDRLWHRRFGGRPDVLGRVLTLDGTPRTIVGVMPPAFRFPDRADLWVPASPRLAVEGRRLQFAFLNALARLRGSTSTRAAEDALPVPRLAPPTPTGPARAAVMRLEDLLVGRVRPVLWLMAAATGLVLLIACVNVANLLVARGASRTREIAIRSALGAGRLRLVRQLAVETLVLAAAGAAAGFGLAAAAVRVFVAYDPVSMPRLDQIGLDAGVTWFTVALALATCLLCGTLPAWHLVRGDTCRGLRDGAGTTAGGIAIWRRDRTRGLLVVAEIAIAVVLLAAAGLLVNSFFRLALVDPGFDPRGLLAVSIQARPAAAEAPAGQRLAYRELVDRVSALPGVISAALADHVPPVAEMARVPAVLEGQTGAEADRMPPVAVVKVTADYFPTMRVPLLAGRLFTDDEADAGARVVVVDEPMARVFSPDQSPIGRRLLVGSELAEIVGVVGAVRQAGLDRPPVPTLYQPNRLGWMPFRQGRMAFVGHTELVVRAAGDPVSLVGAIRAQVDAVDAFDVNRVTTVDQALWTSILQPRFHATLFGAFAVVGLVLAAVGLYGVMAFAVARGTQEIGVRMALGAGRAEVRRAVLGQGLALAVAGVGAGLAAALAVTRLLESMLFGVTTTDWRTFAATATLLAAVALVACWVPARRATRVDPIVALRFE